MKIPIEIRTFELELTRDCNSSCLHCMRGKKEKINMTPDIIERTFNSTTHKIIKIGECLITGGEPFTNIEGFVYFLEYLLNNNIKIYDLDIITNALIYNREIIKLLKHLEKRGTNISLITRGDQFHPKVPLKNLFLFNKTEFYENTYEYLEKKDIIPLGNAFLNNLGNRNERAQILKNFDKDVLNYLIILYIREKLITIKSLYITCKGYFGSVPNDATWKMIDNKYTLNILKDSLFTSCQFADLECDLKYLKTTNMLPPIERLKEDYENNYFNDFYSSLNEDILREYLINPLARKRIRN